MVRFELDSDIVLYLVIQYCFSLSIVVVTQADTGSDP